MPVVFLLAIAVVGGVWWLGTRHYDFLNSPPGSPLEIIHTHAASSLPKKEDEAAPEAPSKVAVETTSPPTLALYREGSSMNAKDLLELSSSLESQGETQRALLAAERVIDSTQPDGDQMRTALDAIRRLRPQVPAWNDEPAMTFPVTLHAGAGKSTAILLEPMLLEIATEIERASSGMLKVTSGVTAGRDIPEDIGPPVVAVWFSGPAGDGRSTEVLTFTVLSPETLRDDLAGSLLQLLRGHIGRDTFLRIPESDLVDSNPVALFRTHVTRLVWLELGSRLNPANE